MLDFAATFVLTVLNFRTEVFKVSEFGFGFLAYFETDTRAYEPGNEQSLKPLGPSFNCGMKEPYVCSANV